MGFPGEEIVTKAVESLSSSLIKKMDAAEARREREFSLKLKELEFYKSNYDKELKKIFDYWFELVRVVLIKDNKNLSQAERDKYAKEYGEYLKKYIMKLPPHKDNIKELKFRASKAEVCAMIGTYFCFCQFIYSSMIVSDIFSKDIERGMLNPYIACGISRKKILLLVSGVTNPRDRELPTLKLLGKIL